jgi:homoserine kinase type II
MAVYTVLEREEIERFIAPFGLGPLVDYEGVADGIENTTYFITTDQSEFGSEVQTEPLQQFVLTIFEEIGAKELAFYVKLTTLLSLRGLPVPCPVTDSDGKALHTLHGKPATIVPKVKGQHPTTPTVAQCQAIGQTLGDIHQQLLANPMQHDSHRNLAWLSKLREELADHVDPEDRELLDEVSRFQALVSQHPDLPRAVIHGDLFRDNTLFAGDQLTGIIDFNSAGDGYLAFDLAVTVNDWCSQADGTLDEKRSQALLNGYRGRRPLTADETLLWNDFLRIAATRFWLSRLATEMKLEASHRPGHLAPPKDPKQFQTILMQRIHHPSTLD